MSKELMNTTEMKEVISKRTACMKVFEHADHRFTAAIYGTPVHYMKDGRWEEIDNRLVAAVDEPPSDEDEIESEESTALQAAGWQGRFILRGVDNTHLLHATVPQLRRDQGLDAHTLAQDVLTRN